MDAEHLWYFAYGSNMSRATFHERRGMVPLETHVASLEGFKLCFDIPVGPGERGVANLESAAAAVTHGVAYLLTIDDAERLDRTEGVPRIYVRHPVSLWLADARTVHAFTYRGAISVPTRKPSARYLGLVLDGARTHGLPEAYIRALEDLELAVDERIPP
jgi:cation transport regulator ChaC